MPVSVAFGMIGASSIGPEALLEPAARRKDVGVHRIAARRAGAAEAYGRHWGVGNFSSNYEELLADPKLDAVYISNAAVDHAYWTIAALTAGKHVLCETPIALNGSEARAIAGAARDAKRIVMEGFHYRFHPLFATLLHLTNTKRFGRLTTITSSVNGKRAYDPSSILHLAALGGGSLLHNGTYAVHWSRLLFDSEPLKVTAQQELNPGGADSETTARMTFPGNRMADLGCSFNRSDEVSTTLRFDTATVVATGAISPHHGHSLRINPSNRPSEVVTVCGRSSFDYQLDEFVRRVKAACATDAPQPSTSRGDDIAANSDAIAAIGRSAASGRVEEIRTHPATSREGGPWPPHRPLDS